MNIVPPSIEEINGREKCSHGWLAAGIIIMGLTTWLWMSWRNGWFPFSLGATVTAPEKIEQQLSEKDVIDSLTSSASSSATLSPSALKSLTSSPAKKNAKPIDPAVLDSLTPSKK